jgi:hypothetical protein
MMNEEVSRDAVFNISDAIKMARENGYFPELLNDARSDPIAMQSIWVAAKGPRSNDNKTFNQVSLDVATNFLLKEINAKNNLAANLINRWILMLCNSWPHTGNYFNDINWKPYFALYLFGAILGVDRSLYPMIDFFGSKDSLNDGDVNLIQFDDLSKNALDLCIVKQILLRIQAIIWKKFFVIDSNFKNLNIDFSSLDKANLNSINNFIYKMVDIIEFISENQKQLLDIKSFIDTDFHKKYVNLTSLGFALTLFSGFSDLMKKIDDNLKQLVIDNIM